MNNRWRPLKFSKEELEKKIDEYFKNTPIEEQMITGLAVHLDTSRQTLCNYEERDDFFDTIKRAKDKIEMAYEKRGLKVGNAFDIFRLKNMGWKDRMEQEFSGEITNTNFNTDVQTSGEEQENLRQAILKSVPNKRSEE